jgi:predicted Zn-dependent peptidase
MLTLPLALALAAAPNDSARPPTTAPAQEGPAVTVHNQPAIPVVALRLSILAADPPGYSGAGHLIQHLLLPSLEDQAARVGGTVSASRSTDAIVYQVLGPASELDYLAGILRGALRAPAPGNGEMIAALSALAGERAAERETAQQYVRAALRAQLFPEDLPAAGTELSATRLEAGRLESLWGEIYSPERVQVVAVGDVGIDAVRRAFRALPSPPGAAAPEALADTVPALAADTPQATRGWIGAAWAAGDAEPAAVSVTARLLRSTLRRRMTRSQVDVEHWWTHRGQAIALVVATPDSLVASARRTVNASLTTLGTAVTDDAVRDAAAAVRRDMLFYARAPERMAELLGEFADRDAGPDAAQRYFAALDAVTADDVRGVIDRLQQAGAVTVFVPPQKIPAAQRR